MMEINEIKKSKNWVGRSVRGKRPMKRRGVGSRELTTSFSEKIIKMASQ